MPEGCLATDLADSRGERWRCLCVYKHKRRWRAQSFIRVYNCNRRAPAHQPVDSVIAYIRSSAQAQPEAHFGQQGHPPLPKLFSPPTKSSVLTMAIMCLCRRPLRGDVCSQQAASCKMTFVHVSIDICIYAQHCRLHRH